MNETQRQSETLRRLLDVSLRMAVTTDLDALLAQIVDTAREVLRCERATIFLYDKSRDELCSRVATGVDTIRVPAGMGIAGAAARERRPINVPDAYADARFNQDVDRRTGFRTRNLFAFPLENLGGELMGVLQALNKESGPFDREDEELARVLSAQAGVALHRWFLLQEYAEKQRMARDLEIARQIQLSFFPASNPQVAGYEIAGWNQSAEQTGGDCYDFYPLEDGRLAVLLADATGHGIGAALVMAQCRSMLRGLLSMSVDLPQVLRRVNGLLLQDLADGRFVTAFVGILDARRHRIDYVSTGQAPLLFVANGEVSAHPATSLPLAVAPDAEFEARSFAFGAGGLLALLTDGFFETMNAADEQFGEERIGELLRSGIASGESLDGAISRMHDAVRAFRGDAPQADDLTAVLVRRR